MPDVKRPIQHLGMDGAILCSNRTRVSPLLVAALRTPVHTGVYRMQSTRERTPAAIRCYGASTNAANREARKCRHSTQSQS
jgi:hypothetical protein